MIVDACVLVSLLLYDLNKQCSFFLFFFFEKKKIFGVNLLNLKLTSVDLSDLEFILFSF